MTVVLHVDGIPMLWGGPHPVVRRWFQPLGRRAWWAYYDGPYPLTGEALAVSEAKLAEIIPLIPALTRGVTA